ncbi:MAG: hypothetical protein ABWY63_14160 [Hyphomicrobiaceae bacterium]
MVDVPPIWSPVSLTSYYDPYDGSVLGAKLFFYKTNTLDPITVWTTVEQATPYAQPVLTGGSGRVPPVWVPEIDPDNALANRYRVRVFDQYDTLLEDIDGLPAAAEITTGETPPALPEGVDKKLFSTGYIFPVFAKGSTTIPDGVAVRCNGGTIGNPASGATERANADCWPLYEWLWGQDELAPNNLLAVTDNTGAPGKGPSAASDWAANKKIQTPDLRGRTPIGIDPMGAAMPASGRLTNVTFQVGAGTLPGGAGGSGNHILLIGEIPVHKHTVNDPTHNHVINNPVHNHGGGVYDVGHGHVLNDYGHIHTYSRYTAVTPNTQTVGTLNQARNNETSNTSGAKHADNPSVDGANLTISPAGTGVQIYAEAQGSYATGIGTGITLSDNGGGLSHPNMQPFLSLSWWIHL